MGFRHTLYFIKKEEINKLKKLNWEDNWDEIDNILEKYPSLELGKMYYGNNCNFIDTTLQHTINIIPSEDLTCELVNDDFDILQEYQNMCIENFKEYYSDYIKEDKEIMLEEFKLTMRVDLLAIKRNEFGWANYKEQWYQCEIIKQFMKSKDYCIVVYGG